MKKTNKYYAVLVASLVIVVLFFIVPLITNTKDNEIVTSSEEINASLTTYYEDDDVINGYINRFNDTNQDIQITADMLSVYRHHGRDHKDQVRLHIDGHDITVSSKPYSDNAVGVFIDNTATHDNNERMRQLALMFLLSFDERITAADFNECLLAANITCEIYDVDFMVYTNVNKDAIEYINIEGVF